tara:strand:- start:731 stop:1288 length:558 start_codon:yes stop_codon:yes gene_type:complete
MSDNKYESSYLGEILKGMKITMGHVIKNVMNPEGIPTVEYPEVRKVMPDRYRGAHRLTTEDDGTLKCVACMCCPTVCPANCITIVAGEGEGDVEKYPVRFEIDMLRCIFCGFCVEACPKDAIRMDTAIYAVNGFTRQDMVYTKPYMQNLMDGEKPISAVHYRENPEDAPVGYRADIKPVIPSASE